MRERVVCCLCVMQDLSYLESRRLRIKHIYEVSKSGIWRGCRVDASYGGSLFTTLWTFYKMYSIQMPQMHCKIMNLIKIFMD